MKYPDFDLRWEYMVHELICSGLPPPHIQTLLEIHERLFSETELDLIGVICILANLMDEGDVVVQEDSFIFVLRASVAKRLDSLNFRDWRFILNDRIERFMEFEGTLQNKIRDFFIVFMTVELQKEVASLLELALWKAALDNHIQKKVRDILHRIHCRINCGAEVIIQNVLPFIWSEYIR